MHPQMVIGCQRLRNGSGPRVVETKARDLDSQAATIPKKLLGIGKKVKTKEPNELGIYDMSGNIYEWCYIPDGGAVQGGCWACPEEYIQLDREYRHYLPQVKNLEPFPGEMGFRPARNNKTDPSR
ncbi:MAG: hypothetical protein EB101_11410 [Chitinophagia bacterium]|nr:hypothetical protein [Chitinophagia bacterium]